MSTYLLILTHIALSALLTFSAIDAYFSDQTLWMYSFCAALLGQAVQILHQIKSGKHDVIAEEYIYVKEKRIRKRRLSL